MEYEDYYGNVYTESTVLYDTIPRVMNKHYEVEITTITPPRHRLVRMMRQMYLTYWG